MSGELTSKITNGLGPTKIDIQSFEGGKHGTIFPDSFVETMDNVCTIFQKVEDSYPGINKTDICDKPDKYIRLLSCQEQKYINGPPCVDKDTIIRSNVNFNTIVHSTHALTPCANVFSPNTFTTDGSGINFFEYNNKVLNSCPKVGVCDIGNNKFAATKLIDQKNEQFKGIEYPIECTYSIPKECDSVEIDSDNFITGGMYWAVNAQGFYDKNGVFKKPKSIVYSFVFDRFDFAICNPNGSGGALFLSELKVLLEKYYAHIVTLSKDDNLKNVISSLNEENTNILGDLLNMLGNIEYTLDQDISSSLKIKSSSQKALSSITENSIILRNFLSDINIEDLLRLAEIRDLAKKSGISKRAIMTYKEFVESFSEHGFTILYNVYYDNDLYRRMFANQTSKLTEYGNTLNNHITTLTEHKNDISDIYKNIYENDRTLDSHLKFINSITADVSKLNLKTNDIYNELKNADTANFNSLKAVLDNLDLFTQSLKTEVSDLRAIAEKNAANFNLIASQLSSSHTQSLSRISDIEENLNLLRSKLDSTSLQAKENFRLITVNTDSIKTLGQDITKNKNEISKLGSRVSLAEEKMNTNEKSISDLQANFYKQISRNNDNFNAINLNLLSLNLSFIKDRETIRKELDQLDETTSSLLDDISALKNTDQLTNEEIRNIIVDIVKVNSTAMLMLNNVNDDITRFNLSTTDSLASIRDRLTKMTYDLTINTQLAEIESKKNNYISRLKSQIGAAERFSSIEFNLLKNTYIYKNPYITEYEQYFNIEAMHLLNDLSSEYSREISESYNKAQEIASEQETIMMNASKRITEGINILKSQLATRDQIKAKEDELSQILKLSLEKVTDAIDDHAKKYQSLTNSYELSKALIIHDDYEIKKKNRFYQFLKNRADLLIQKANENREKDYAEALKIVDQEKKFLALLNSNVKYLKTKDEIKHILTDEVRIHFFAELKEHPYVLHEVISMIPKTRLFEINAVFPATYTHNQKVYSLNDNNPNNTYELYQLDYLGVLQGSNQFYVPDSHLNSSETIGTKLNGLSLLNAVKTSEDQIAYKREIIKIPYLLRAKDKYNRILFDVILDLLTMHDKHYISDEMKNKRMDYDVKISTPSTTTSNNLYTNPLLNNSLRTTTNSLRTTTNSLGTTTITPTETTIEPDKIEILPYIPNNDKNNLLIIKKFKEHMDNVFNQINSLQGINKQSDINKYIFDYFDKHIYNFDYNLSSSEFTRLLVDVFSSYISSTNIELLSKTHGSYNNYIRKLEISENDPLMLSTFKSFYDLTTYYRQAGYTKDMTVINIEDNSLLKKDLVLFSGEKIEEEEVIQVSKGVRVIPSALYIIAPILIPFFNK